MDTLLHFKSFCEEIRSSNSRKHKQWVLDRFKNDKVIKRYLKIAFDPYTRYGIGYDKLARVVRVDNTWCAPTVFDLFDYLEVHNTGRDVDVAVCQLALDWLTGEEDIDSYKLLCGLICKDISIGVDAKQINAVMPDLIPTFNVQLAQKYFEKPEKLEGKTFAITTKLDGFRLIAMKDEHGNVSFYSRVGQPAEGLVEIEAEMKAAFPSGIVFDGELTISNYFELESKEAYKAASKIIRLKGDTPKRGLTYRVFDVLTIEEWRTQNCTHTYDERRNLLEGFFGYVAAPIPHIEVLPVLYRGNDTTKVTEWLEKITSEGGEGVMLNLVGSPYRFTRCWDIMKVKKMNTLDLEIVGFEEGSGRLAGTLGAIHVRYKDGNIVKVGSGFSDTLRAEIWQDRDKWLGAIVEIQYFEETTNADGGISLRFPIFKDLRLDKLEADF